MAYSKGIKEYDFDHRRRGLCVIISNATFDQEKDIKGGFVDEMKITKVFKDLGFEVRLHIDLKASKMEDVLQKAAEENHSDADCFACVLSSHGDEGVIYGTDSEEINIDKLTDFFKGNNCPSLAGKPKLFFIEACRGSEDDRGTNVGRRGTTASPGVGLQRIPVAADFLIAYAVSKGYSALCHPKEGSWYTQTLCDVLEEHGKTMDLHSMLTMVNRKVGRDRETSSGIKQAPCFLSGLIKNVRFSRK